jgi:hypothetical protein
MVLFLSLNGNKCSAVSPIDAMRNVPRTSLALYLRATATSAKEHGLLLALGPTLCGYLSSSPSLSLSILDSPFLRLPFTKQIPIYLSRY